MSGHIELLIAELAATNGGHMTRAGLTAAGVGRHAVRNREASGLLVPVGAQTFRLRSVPRTSAGDVIAACLEYDGVASHRTATWQHACGRRPNAVDVLVRSGTTLRPRAQVAPEAPAVVIHTTTSLPAADITYRGAIALTSVARTALNMAALVPGEVSRRELEELIGRAVDLDLATDDWLWWLLDKRRCRGRNGVSALETVLAKRAELGPTESYLERRVLDILQASGLPLPSTQQVIRRRGRFAARVDFCYQPERIVLEALGYAHHRTPAEMEADTRRMNQLVLAGYDTYQFTYRQATGDPSSLVRTVGGALDKAASRAGHSWPDGRAA